VAGVFAAGFARPGTLYLTLPDVRPFATANPTTTQHRIAPTKHEKGQKPRRAALVSYSHLSPDLKRAVLVAEDDAFFQVRASTCAAPGVAGDRLGERVYRGAAHHPATGQESLSVSVEDPLGSCAS
jgi:membrane peptidoglycan carboxypeptidase